MADPISIPPTPADAGASTSAIDLREITVTKYDDTHINAVRKMPISRNFTRRELFDQRAAVVQKDQDDHSARADELQEIDFYLSECDRLGIL